MPYYFVSKIPVKTADEAKFTRDFFAENLEPKLNYTAEHQQPANLHFINQEDDKKALEEAKALARHLQGKNDAYRFIIFEAQFSSSLKGSEHSIDLKGENGTVIQTINTFKEGADQLYINKAIVVNMPEKKTGFLGFRWGTGPATQLANSFRWGTGPTIQPVNDVTISFKEPIYISLPPDSDELENSFESVEKKIDPTTPTIAETTATVPAAENTNPVIAKSTTPPAVGDDPLPLPKPEAEATVADSEQAAQTPHSKGQQFMQQLGSLSSGLPNIEDLKRLAPFAVIATGSALAAKLGYVSKGISYFAALKGKTILVSKVGFAATWGTASALFGVGVVAWLALEAAMQSSSNKTDDKVTSSDDIEAPKSAEVDTTLPISTEANAVDASPGRSTSTAEAKQSRMVKQFTPAESYAANLAAAKANRDWLLTKLGYQEDSQITQFVKSLEQDKKPAFTHEGALVAGVLGRKQQDLALEYQRQSKWLRRIEANIDRKDQIEQAMQARTRISVR